MIFGFGTFAVRVLRNVAGYVTGFDGCDHRAAHR